MARALSKMDLLLVSAALLLGWNAPAAAQSCGEIGGDYCSQSGSCPSGFESLGQTYDCNPCCREVEQGPSCGEVGGNWCSQTGSCPSGYDSLGQTYDCRPCCRQRSQGQMSFSVYNGGSVSNGVVYANSSVIDNSWGCTHSGYWTSATIRSPSGRSAVGQSSGLQASTSLALAGEFGNYQIVTFGTYYCSCAMATAGFGGGQTLPVKRPYFLHKYADFYKYPTPYLYHRVRDYQVQDTNYAPIQRVMSTYEWFQNGIWGCGEVQIDQGGGPTTASGTFRDNLYLDTPRCRPGGSYNCFISRDQHWEIDGIPVNPVFQLQYTCDQIKVW